MIISGGAVADYAYTASLLRGDDTIICADSGYDHAVKMGIVPNIVVGDFDSVRGEIPAKMPRLTFPSRKDKTDTEIAIDYARGEGFRDFLLLGCAGNRLDHTLANIFLLKGFVLRNENVAFCDDFNLVIPMGGGGQVRIDRPCGTIVSLIALDDCTGVTTEGLEYPLENAVLRAGDTLGVSNVVAKKPATVFVKSGLLLVICAVD